jgi:hypothetical protein
VLLYLLRRIAREHARLLVLAGNVDVLAAADVNRAVTARLRDPANDVTCASAQANIQTADSRTIENEHTGFNVLGVNFSLVLANDRVGALPRDAQNLTQRAPQTDEIENEHQLF